MFALQGRVRRGRARRPSLALAAVLSVLSAGERGARAADVSDARKTTSEDLSVAVERLVLANGLVVLLSRDPTATSVLVDMAFRAGTVYEPPDRSGLAHFVEHALMRGATPETDYLELLERRRAREVNAFTTPKMMVFRTEVPPEELPLALWVAADRFATPTAELDAAQVVRHRRVIEAERAERYLDVPYGPAEQAIVARIFPAPHPLRGRVIGVPEELAKITVDDVRAFARQYIVPNNGILTIVGDFELDVAKRWVGETVARIAAGEKPREPTIHQAAAKGAVLKVVEPLSRRPRVTVLWQLDDLTRDVADTLEFGALLLSSYTDGAFGTEVSAEVFEQGGCGYFRLDLTLPHDKPMDSAVAEAEVFLRYLTAVDMPRDVFNATRIARDRVMMFALDDLHGRANLLTAIEAESGDATRAAAYIERHWGYARHDVQHVAWKALITGPPRLVIHARPSNPMKPKLDWDERE